MQCNCRWWYFREQQHCYETNLKSVKIMFYFFTTVLYYFWHLTAYWKILSSFFSISQSVWSDHTHEFYLPSSSRFTHVLQPKLCWNPRTYVYLPKYLTQYYRSFRCDVTYIMIFEFVRPRGLNKMGKRVLEPYTV